MTNRSEGEMTDEERATRLIQGYRDNDHSDDWLEAELVKLCRSIREECAKVAEDYAEGCKNADERIAMDHCVAIAQAIRTGVK